MITECDIYKEIFNGFLKTQNDENEKALWKMKTILNLMKLTKSNDQRDLCENGLRMIMILYNNYTIYPFEIRSSCTSAPSLSDSSELVSILKSELV
jgi:hypothetical protein